MTHGQSAFTTTEAGTYFACFWVDESHKATTSVTVSLDWRTGIAAKDWESVARKEKIEASKYTFIYSYTFILNLFALSLSSYHVSCNPRVLNWS